MMAGTTHEIEEPAICSLDFQHQPDSIHSGSISFGRFETEPLCWERRSSFSHNRYLDEVDKIFSKPGSVIQKKAYFEAHFRKKGLLSSETYHMSTDHTTHYQQAGCCENDNLENSPRTYNHEDREEINDIVTQSEPVFFGHSSDDVVDDNTNFVLERGEIEEAAANLDTSHIVSNMTIGVFVDNNQVTEQNGDASFNDERVSSPKEKILMESESMKPSSLPQVSAEQNKRYISSKASNVSGKRPSKTVNNVLMKSKSEQKTSEAAAKGKTPKSEPGRSKAKEVSDIKRVGGKLRNKITAEPPQSSTLPKVSSRVHQSANRVKPSASETSQSAKHDSSRLSSRNDTPAGRRKEFDVKLREKMNAEANVHQLKTKTRVKTATELKQLRTSSINNFKATPLPSFYREAASLDTRKNKANIVNNVKPRRLQTKSSITGTELNTILISNEPPSSKTYPPQQSSPGVTSCNSTVTSESSPSSPAAAETSNIYPSQPTKGNLVSGRKNEKPKEKITSLNKSKAPAESTKKKFLHKGKGMA